jgi:hypothetical protein
MTLPTSVDFLIGLQNQRRTGTPPSLSDVCDALDNYHAGRQRGTADEQAGRLFIVYDAARRWLKKYPNCPKGGAVRQDAYQSWQGKYSAVSGLRNDAAGEINGLFPGLGDALFDYEDRKKQGARTSKLKGLGAGYDNERKTFVAGGKKAAPFSGNKVHSVAGTKPAKDVTDAPFEKLNPAQFNALGAKVKGVATMYWCSRMQRLKFRVEYSTSANQWVTINGAQVHHPIAEAKNEIAEEKEWRMYAMDRYGNLFVDEDSVQYAALRNLGNVANRKGPAEQARGVMNHSSFCAGREVICAGNIYIWKGQLLHIDNGSGHYAPTRDHLRKALKSLAADFGMPTGYLRVGVHGVGYFTYDDFAKGRNTPDWPDQDMGSDQRQIFSRKGARL